MMRLQILGWVLMPGVLLGQNLIRQSHYGGSEEEHAYDMVSTGDGGFLLVGTTLSYAAGTAPNIFALKIDSLGNVLWAKRYGSTQTYYPFGVVATSFGFAIGGWNYASSTHKNDMIILQIDQSGNLIRINRYRKSGLKDYAYDIALAPSGDMLLAGTTQDAQGRDQCAIVRVHSDNTLDTSWNFGTDSTKDYLEALAVEPQGPLVAVGLYGTSSDTNCLVARVSPAGNLIWAKHFGGSATDRLSDVVVSGTGYYYLVGRTRSAGQGGEDILVAKVDTLGVPVWIRAYGGSNNDRAWAALLVGETLLVAGSTRSFGAGDKDGFVMALDTADGDVFWAWAFGAAGSDELETLAKTSYGYAGGGLYTAGANEDFWFVSVREDGSSCLGERFDTASGFGATGDLGWTLVSLPWSLSDGGFYQTTPTPSTLSPSLSQNVICSEPTPLGLEEPEGSSPLAMAGAGWIRLLVPAEVYLPDGRLLATAGPGLLPAARGIYIVVAGKRVQRVLVR